MLSESLETPKIGYEHVLESNRPLIADPRCEPAVQFLLVRSMGRQAAHSPLSSLQKRTPDAGITQWDARFRVENRDPGI